MSLLAELATTMLANVQPGQPRQRTLAKGLQLHLALLGADYHLRMHRPRSEPSMREIAIVWAAFGIPRDALGHWDGTTYAVRWRVTTTAPAPVHAAPAGPPAPTHWPLPPGTPCFADVLLYTQRARNAPAAEHDRLLGCARNIIAQHWPLDWRAAFAREHVDAVLVAALLD